MCRPDLRDARVGPVPGRGTELTKRGNSYLRYYLVEAANSVRQHCPEYGRYYSAKYAETPKHVHQRALMLTARKLVRLLDVLLREGKRYVAPEERVGHSETTAPHTTRPARQRRSKQAPAIEQVRRPCGYGLLVWSNHHPTRVRAGLLLSAGRVPLVLAPPDRKEVRSRPCPNQGGQPPALIGAWAAP